MRFALERVLTEPEMPEMRSAFPYGVEVISSELENGVVTVNLSSPYDTLRGFMLSEANACIVKTLTQFEEVNYVRLLVDGRNHPGQSSQLYSAADFLDVALS
jgi:spore germination protein GerM